MSALKNSLVKLAAALVLLPGAAQAVQIAAGTAVNVNIRQCVAGNDPTTGTWSYCTFLPYSPPAYAYGGFPGATVSSAGLSGDPRGSALAQVSLSGTAGAPILQGMASTPYVALTPGSTQWRTTTNAVALQRFVYSGPETTRTFGATLTYSQSATAPFPNSVGGGIYAALDVFTLPVASIDAGSTAAENFASLVGVAGQQGYHSLASAEFFDATPTDSGSHLLITTPSVTLHDGDAVWVWALLQTPAVNGASIDAYHTFRTAWDNSEGLTPAAVPEPGTWLLMAIGVLAGAPIARRAGAKRPR